MGLLSSVDRLMAEPVNNLSRNGYNDELSKL
jgi:hypothetical protein